MLLVEGWGAYPAPPSAWAGCTAQEAAARPGALGRRVLVRVALRLVEDRGADPAPLRWWFPSVAFERLLGPVRFLCRLPLNFKLVVVDDRVVLVEGPFEYREALLVRSSSGTSFARPQIEITKRAAPVGHVLVEGAVVRCRGLPSGRVEQDPAFPVG